MRVCVLIIHTISICIVCVSWEELTLMGSQNLAPQKTFQVFFFQLYFNKIYVEVAICDFTMHLIISKWFRIQKCRLKTKTMRQRGRSERRNCQRKCFHSVNYVTDQASIRFFFNVNCLHCFVSFLLYYLLHLFSSDLFAALTSLQLYNFII